TILSGDWGDGKPSLVNLFKPELTQVGAANSDLRYKERHTTSYASMIKLGRGVDVIDTPGTRRVVVRQRGHIPLSAAFLEYRALMNHGKLRECRHIDEAGCAALEAVKDGRISERRYGSYKGIVLGISGREGRTRDDSRETGGRGTEAVLIEGLELDDED